MEFGGEMHHGGGDFAPGLSDGKAGGLVVEILFQPGQVTPQQLVEDGVRRGKKLVNGGARITQPLRQHRDGEAGQAGFEQYRLGLFQHPLEAVLGPLL